MGALNRGEWGIVSAMRELSTDDLGLLLSVFALLLISFAIDFHVAKGTIARHRRRALFFASVAVVGEFMTALALVLSWVALWSPAAWAKIDDLLVFIPGSIAVLCAVILTVEKTLARMIVIVWTQAARAAETDEPDEGDD